jgi:RsiW-degrading membrane proteinase PrsW (M82 family)
MNGADQWYYLDGAHTRGPVASAEIAQLVHAGALSSATQVAQSGWQTWSPASVALAHLLAGGGLAPTFAIRLQCVSGPDQGQAFMIGMVETSLGRAAGIGRYDPLVADSHVVLSWQNNVLYFRTFGGAVIRVAGADVTQGALSNGQQFQLGASVWRVGTAPVDLGGLLGSLSDRLTQLAATDKLEGFSLRQMFSEVFKKRRPGEVEEYLIAGTEKTTPPIEEVQTGWPKPWLFMRVLIFLALVYLGLALTFDIFGVAGGRVIPGVMVIGAMIVPLAVVFLFFELNTPRNVTFYRVLAMFCLGGAISLFFAIFGFEGVATGNDWLGASKAGLVEEPAKLLAVVIVVGRLRTKYVLNGIMFGAAVGAGFAAFETAGYAFFEGYDNINIARMLAEIMAQYGEHTKPIMEAIFNFMLGKTELSEPVAKVIFPAQVNGYNNMIGLLWTRTYLAPFGHVVWTAITAGALWRVKRSAPLHVKMLIEPSFIRAFFIPVGLHMIWNSPLISRGLVGGLERVGLGIIAYFVVFGMVQQGLRQVKEEQLQRARATLHQSQEILTVSGRFRAVT